MSSETGYEGSAQATGRASQSWLPDRWDHEADIVIVGFGGAGCSAAIAAHDAGQEVLVLEKDPIVRGGNTGVSGGITRIITPLSDFITYMKLCCWGTVTDDDLIAAHCAAVTDNPAWIRSLGGDVVEFQSKTLRRTLESGGTPRALVEGFVSPQFHDEVGWSIKSPSGGVGYGQQLFAFLSGCAAARGITAETGRILTSTPATGLIQDPVTGEVLGVKARAGVQTDKNYHQSGGTEILIKARKAVILACGGYEFNPEMQDNFTADVAHGWRRAFAGTPFNTGDGVWMAARAGAKLWHMNKKEMNEYACRPATEEFHVSMTMEHVYGMREGGEIPGILVNRYGKRFQNEHHSMNHNDDIRPLNRFAEKWTDTDGVSACEYPNLPCYWIFDQIQMKQGPLMPPMPIRWANVHNLYQWSADNQAELDKGWIIKGNTLEELASKIRSKDIFGRVVDMDPASLAKTVNDYNGYCATACDPEFGRKPSTLLPLAEPPYYAVEIIESSVNTDGGPQHNQFSQTVGVDGSPIPRLYSCGELGSIFGFLYYGGGNVSEGLAMGRVAGQHAARLEEWDR